MLVSLPNSCGIIEFKLKLDLVNFRFSVMDVSELTVSVVSAIGTLMTDFRRIWKNSLLLFGCSSCFLNYGCGGFETDLLMILVVLF